MKSVWLLVWPLAVNAISKTQTLWDSEGHVLTFSDVRCPPHKVYLNDFRTFARSLVAEAQERLEELLPSDIRAVDLFDAVNFSSLMDSCASQRSLFNQNQATFQPLAKKIFQSLTSKNEVKHKLSNRRTGSGNYPQLKAWFKKEQELLQSILLAFSFTSGITPRGFQLADLRFESSRGQKRNVFLMKGYLVIGWLGSKGFGRGTRAGLWSLPPVLGQVVVIYLGILRPAALMIAESAELNPSPDAMHMLFAKTMPLRTRIGSWDSKYISRVFKARTTEPIGLDIGPQRLRQITTAVFRKHLPGLIEPKIKSLDQASLQTSYANLQADHSQHVSSLHYGIGFGPLSGLDLSDADVDHFIEISQALQAMFGLIPGSRRMLDRLYRVPQFCQSSRMDFAYDRARILLCKVYKLGGEPKSSQVTARFLLSSQPFFPSLHKSVRQSSLLIDRCLTPPQRLGDKILWEIASAIIFGRGCPGATDAVPPSGYSPLVITDAIILVSLFFTTEVLFNT